MVFCLAYNNLSRIDGIDDAEKDVGGQLILNGWLLAFF